MNRKRFDPFPITIFTSMDDLYLQNLNLINFKTYPELELDLNARINCFVGNNGVGKTNLFDAIYYLAFCKSYFSGLDGDNIRHGEDFLTIHGKFHRDGSDEDIFCGLQRSEKKRFRRNDKDYQRLADHIGLIPLVMVSPSDANLILDGSEERRRYMNGVISQYDRQYLDDVIRYNKALQQRNRVLKDFARSGRFDEDVLYIWDEQMTETGDRICQARGSFISQLVPVFQEYYEYISAGQEKVELIYHSSVNDESMSVSLNNSRGRDRLVKYTTQGVHRDDLQLNLSGYPMKQQGSQGQQKTYLISLKLAQYDFLKKIREIRPLILLDDVFDKLDKIRVTQLIKLVSDDNFGQIFITDTNYEHMAGILSQIPVASKVFIVEQGMVNIAD